MSTAHWILNNGRTGDGSPEIGTLAQTNVQFPAESDHLPAQIQKDARTNGQAYKRTIHPGRGREGPNEAYPRRLRYPLDRVTYPPNRSLERNRMIGAGEVRKGVAVEIDDTLYRVIDFSHHKTGRGSAQIRLKLKDVKGGHIIDRSFQASERFARARIEKRTMSFLYEAEGQYTFMDTETYNQVNLGRDQLEDAIPYLVENIEAEVISYEGDPIGIELPAAVALAVAQTEPGFKGDTAQGGTKIARMETGLVVQVPLFIETGEKLKIDTRTGQYLTRV